MIQVDVVTKNPALVSLEKAIRTPLLLGGIPKCFASQNCETFGNHSGLFLENFCRLTMLTKLGVSKHGSCLQCNLGEGINTGVGCTIKLCQHGTFDSHIYF